MTTTTKTQVRVNDQEIEMIFREIENQIPTPFISVTLCTDFRNMVKKSKIDGTINPYYKELKKVVLTPCLFQSLIFLVFEQDD